MGDWPLLLLVAIDVLAVHRAARLITADTITVQPRRAIIAWSYQRWTDLDDEAIFGDGSGGNDLEAMVEADEIDDPCTVPKLAVLVTCRWCASVWLSAVAVAGHGLVPALWFPLAAVLALSSASTLLAGLED